MGCGGSQPAPAAAKPITVTAEPMQEPQQPAHKPAHKGAPRKASKFQIELGGKFQDYGDEEDRVLKRAYLVGLPNAKFSLRGQHYEYSFAYMQQKNLGTNKERKIRPPLGMPAPPKPLLPAGPMIVIKVPPGGPGKTIEVEDPNNKGRKIQVNVPPGARVGQKMAVPVPAKGETVEQVQEKQTKHSTAAKVAMGVGGVAVVSGLAVGGVILGDHLSGGAVTEAAGDAFGDGAGEAMAAATAWTEGAAEDVAEVAKDAGEGIADFGEDAIDWLGDAAEDVGDFVMDLF